MSNFSKKWTVYNNSTVRCENTIWLCSISWSDHWRDRKDCSRIVTSLRCIGRPWLWWRSISWCSRRLSENLPVSLRVSRWRRGNSCRQRGINGLGRQKRKERAFRRRFVNIWLRIKSLRCSRCLSTSNVEKWDNTLDFGTYKATKRKCQNKSLIKKQN